MELPMSLPDDLAYLAREAYEFSLDVNPHAGFHDTVEEWTSGSRTTSAEPLGDWISDAQREEALATGRLIEGRVYPNGSVSFFQYWGTDMADVVRSCAQACREDQAAWRAGGHAPHRPLGRRAPAA